MSKPIRIHFQRLGVKDLQAYKSWFPILALSVIAEQGDDLTFAHIHAEVYNSQFGISVYLLEVSDVERGCLAGRASCPLKILVFRCAKYHLSACRSTYQDFLQTTSKDRTSKWSFRIGCWHSRLLKTWWIGQGADVGESTLISAILVDLMRIIDAPTSLIHGLVNITASVESLATGGSVKISA